MARKPHGSGIVDFAVYSQFDFADEWQKTPKWVKENIIFAGVRYRRSGQLYLVSGKDFRRWVERGGDDEWDNESEST